MSPEYSAHKKIGKWLLVYSRTLPIKMGDEKKSHEFLTLRDSDGNEFYGISNSVCLGEPLAFYSLYSRIRTWSDVKNKLIKCKTL